MTLILDHINGTHDDNRLENLRIVCPNCNATLPTHCGKNLPHARDPRACVHCERTFQPSRPDQSYCSRACYARSLRGPRLSDRRVKRPPYEQLLEEIATSSWSAVGRKYGVSCNRAQVSADGAAAAGGGRRGRRPRGGDDWGAGAAPGRRIRSDPCRSPLS